MGIATELQTLLADSLSRSALSQPCPIDFPAVDSFGGQLLQVMGPPWTALYSVPVDDRPCPFCGADMQSKVNEGPGARSFAIIDGEVRAACALCLAERSLHGVTDMATAKHTWDLPTCAMCGLPFEDHYRPITSVWAAYCDLDDAGNEIFYKPSKPFRSTNWPFRLITDSPRYTADGKIAYGDDGILTAKAAA